VGLPFLGGFGWSLTLPRGATGRLARLKPFGWRVSTGSNHTSVDSIALVADLAYTGQVTGGRQRARRHWRARLSADSSHGFSGCGVGDRRGPQIGACSIHTDGMIELFAGIADPQLQYCGQTSSGHRAHQEVADKYHAIETLNARSLESFDSYLKGKGKFTAAETY
jgi:hypothetical protein